MQRRPGVEAPAAARREPRTLYVEQTNLPGTLLWPAEALREASAGDVIQIAEGVYYEEQALVLAKDVEIRGAGAEKVLLGRLGIGGFVLACSAGRARVGGVRMRPAEDMGCEMVGGVLCSGGDLELVDCEVEATEDAPCVSATGKCALALRGCSLRGGRVGCRLAGEGVRAALSGCELSLCHTDGVSLAEGASLVMERCRVHDVGQAGVFAGDGCFSSLTNNEIWHCGADGVVGEGRAEALRCNAIKAEPVPSGRTLFVDAGFTGNLPAGLPGDAECFVSLEDALVAARGGDEIVVRAGEYEARRALAVPRCVVLSRSGASGVVLELGAAVGAVSNLTVRAAPAPPAPPPSSSSSSSAGRPGLLPSSSSFGGEGDGMMAVLVRGGRWSLEGLRVTARGSVGVFVREGARAALERCAVSGCRVGVSAGLGARASLSGCDVYGCLRACVEAQAGRTSLSPPATSTVLLSSPAPPPSSRRDRLRDADSLGFGVVAPAGAAGADRVSRLRAWASSRARGPRPARPTAPRRAASSSRPAGRGREAAGLVGALRADEAEAEAVAEARRRSRRAAAIAEEQAEAEAGAGGSGAVRPSLDLEPLRFSRVRKEAGAGAAAAAAAECPAAAEAARRASVPSAAAVEEAEETAREEGEEEKGEEEEGPQGRLLVVDQEMRPTPGALDGAGRAVLGPYPSLREALAAATDGDEVRVRGGEYVERETLDVTCELAVRAGRGGTVLWLDAPQGRLANLSLAVGAARRAAGTTRTATKRTRRRGWGSGRGGAERAVGAGGPCLLRLPDEPAVAVHQGAEARLYACRLRQCRTGLDALPGARAELTDCAVGPCRQFGGGRRGGRGPAPASCGEAPFKCDPGAALQRG
eukprot:tig00021257_g19740.t1